MQFLRSTTLGQCGDTMFKTAWVEPDAEADTDGNGVDGVSPEPKRCLTPPKEPV